MRLINSRPATNNLGAFWLHDGLSRKIIILIAVTGSILMLLGCRNDLPNRTEAEAMSGEPLHQLRLIISYQNNKNVQEDFNEFVGRYQQHPRDIEPVLVDAGFSLISHQDGCAFYRYKDEADSVVGVTTNFSVLVCDENLTSSVSASSI